MLTPAINTMKTNLNKLSSLSLLAMLGAASGFVASSASAATLVGEWNFDNSDLDNTGSTGATHDGTAIGTLTYTNSTLFGGTGQALDASVASSSMSIDNSSTGAGYVDTFDGTSFSVSLWMKAPVGGSAWQQAARKGGNSNWQISQKNADPNARVIVGGKQHIELNVFNDEWHHIVLAVNGTTAKSYWDNVEIDMGTIARTPDAASALLFGDLVGLVDEIKFYDGVLTSTEVTSLYTTNAIPEPGSYALLAGLAGMAFVMARRRI
jgi:hypothetical protein